MNKPLSFVVGHVAARLSRALGELTRLTDAEWSEFFEKIKEMRYGA